MIKTKAPVEIVQEVQHSRYISFDITGLVEYGDGMEVLRVPLDEEASELPDCLYSSEMATYLEQFPAHVLEEMEAKMISTLNRYKALEWLSKNLGEV